MVNAEKDVPSVTTTGSIEIKGVGACNVTTEPAASPPSAGVVSPPPLLPPEQPTRSNIIISKDNNFFISVLLITFLILMQLKTPVNKKCNRFTIHEKFYIQFSCMIIIRQEIHL